MPLEKRAPSTARRRAPTPPAASAALTQSGALQETKQRHGVSASATQSGALKETASRGAILVCNEPSRPRTAPRGQGAAHRRAAHGERACSAERAYYGPRGGGSRAVREPGEAGPRKWCAAPARIASAVKGARGRGRRRRCRLGRHFHTGWRAAHGRTQRRRDALPEQRAVRGLGAAQGACRREVVRLARLLARGRRRAADDAHALQARHRANTEGGASSSGSVAFARSSPRHRHRQHAKVFSSRLVFFIFFHFFSFGKKSRGQNT